MQVLLMAVNPNRVFTAGDGAGNGAGTCTAAQALDELLSACAYRAIGAAEGLAGRLRGETRMKKHD